MGGVIAKIAITNMYDLYIVDTHPPKFSTSKYCRHVSEVTENNFDIILLAIKPQDFPQVANEVAALCNKYTNIISIMAGIPIKRLQKAFPDTQSFARLMPNLGLENCYGVTLVLDNTQNKPVSEFIQSIFASNGNTVIPVESESDITKLTPFTGSGAALFLNLANILTKKLAHEFKIDKAQEIISSIMMQSINMAKTQTFDKAITKIASKGGITQAMLDNFSIDIDSSINAGQKRAKELEESL